MSRTPITLDLYTAALNAYRADPGNVLNAARVTGLTRAAAKRLWEGPILSTDPEGITPIRGALRVEADRAHAAAVLRRVEEEAAARAEAERRKRVAEEAASMDEGTLRVARSNSLGALAALAQLVPGITSLSKRVNTALQTGFDASGNAIDINPTKAVRVIRDFAACTKDLVAAAKTLAEIERIKEGLPEHMVGIVPMLNTGAVAVGATVLGGSGSDIQDAEEVIARALQAVDRAKRNRLAADATAAGEEVPTFNGGEGPDDAAELADEAALEAASAKPAGRAKGSKNKANLRPGEVNAGAGIVVRERLPGETAPAALAGKRPALYDPDLDDEELGVIDDLPGAGDDEGVDPDDEGMVPAWGPAGI